jgi:putative transposase
MKQCAIRRGSFISATDLVAKIENFVDAYNARSAPFVWTATSDAILGKICKALSTFCSSTESARIDRATVYRLKR